MRIERQFLLRLAQRARDRILSGLQLAAGKGDLSGVIAHRGGALGEQHAWLVGAVGHRDQHRSIGSAPGIGETHVGHQIAQFLRMALFEQRLQPVEQRAHAGSREKVSPWLVTVQSSPRASAICANCS